MEAWWEVDIDAEMCLSMPLAAYEVYVSSKLNSLCWNIIYTLYYTQSRAMPVVDSDRFYAPIREPRTVSGRWEPTGHLAFPRWYLVRSRYYSKKCSTA